MADEAFALSPIHARASLPTDADYDAIHEAFMETARGRWFLGEYAKRNRNADTRLVLDVVERIEASLASQRQAQAEALAQMEAQAQTDTKPQIDLWPELAKALTKTRIEIAQRLMHETNAQAFEAIRASLETIKSVSWALRERGFDSRICDMFDVQVNAITDGYTGLLAESSVVSETEAGVLAAFDTLMQQIEALTNGEDAATDALDMMVDAVADAMSQDDDDASAMPFDDEATAFAAPPAAIVATPSEAAAYPDAAFHEIYGDDSDIEFVDAPVDEPAAPAVPTEPEINRQRLYEAKLGPYRPSVAAGHAHQVSSADDIEIVDVSEEAKPAARPPNGPADEPAEMVSAQPADQPRDNPPALPSQTSLGQALIANGVIQTTRPDPLAPFRRMSQAEKVAFFT